MKMNFTSKLMFSFVLFLSLLFFSGALSSQTTNQNYSWEAYNDCAGTNNISNTTNIEGISETGTLKNFSTGDETTITASFTSGGTPTVRTGDYGGNETDAGTDAYDTFHGKADMAGVVQYGSSGWYVELTFSGLDPAKSYTFATSANRGGSSYIRETKFTISGAAAATNASTPGVSANNNEEVYFNTGYNTITGYVARWSGIITGDDGSFKVRAEANSETEAYAFSVFMLAEETGTNPSVNTSVNELPPFNSSPENYSEIQNYTVAGYNLEEDILITPPEGFEISTDGETWFTDTSVPALTLQQIDGSVPATMIFVRMFSDSEMTFTGEEIIHASGESVSKAVAVSGVVSLTQTVNILVSQSSDDAEERLSSGSVDLTSSDLEMIRDGSNDQAVGVRFQNLELPKGAVIQYAFIEFTAKDAGSADAQLQIYCQDDVNPESFTSSSTNISGRDKTSQMTNWTPGTWTAENIYQTPDLSEIITSVISKSEWDAGNAMTFIIEGSGTRNAHSFDGSSAKAPQLVIGYQLPTDPIILVSGSINDFITEPEKESNAQSYQVSGMNLAGNITITAPAGYELSTDGGTFADILTLTPENGIVSTATVNVRMKSGTTGNYSGNIEHASSGAEIKFMPVNGTIVNFYTLNVFVAPQDAGTITLNPAGGRYPSGTEVEISALSENGYLFSNWSGGLENDQNPAVITIDGEMTVTANFTKAPPWTAYNDLVLMTGQPSENITSFSISGSSRVSEGALVDFATGNETEVRVAITSNNTNYQDDSGDYSGDEADEGTDAYETFHGIVHSKGLIQYSSSSSGWWVELEFTGLNPLKTYTFATTANRNDDTYDDRITKFTLSGADASTNAATDGVTVNNGQSVQFSTGNNTTNGYVARWTGIETGSDGSFIIRAEQGTSENRAYGPSVFMLREESPAGPVIKTTGSLEPFITQPGVPSVAQTYSVNGLNLEGDIEISAPAGFEISADNESFNTNLSLPHNSGTVSPVTVYVRLSSEASGQYNGEISHTSTGAETKNIAVSGSVSLIYTLTITDDGNGTVQMSPEGGSYYDGTTVTLTPEANNGFQFSSWSGPDAGSLTDMGNGTWTLIMDGDKTVTASFSISYCNTVSLTNSADTRMRKSQAATNYGTETTVTISPFTTSPQGGLFKWNISSLPVGAIVNDASISFYVTDGSELVFNLYNLLREWNETTATWDSYDGVNNWSTGGAADVTADRNDINLWNASAVEFETEGMVTIPLNSAGVEVIQGWTESPEINFGVTVQNYSGGSEQDYWIVASKENTDHPGATLNISYCLPEPEVTVVTSSDQTICYNSIPAELNSSVTEGSAEGYTYQWQISPDNSSWSDIQGAVSDTWNHTEKLIADTWFRLMLKKEDSTPAISNVVSITVLKEPVAGTVSESQSLCFGDSPVALVGGEPAGGSGTFTYQWQRWNAEAGDDGEWTDIDAAVELTFNPPSVSAKYRLKQTDETCGNVVLTEETQVTVNKLPAPLFAVNGEEIETGYAGGFCKGENINIAFTRFQEDAGILPLTVSYEVFINGTEEADPTLSKSDVVISVENGYQLFSSDELATGEYLVQVTSVEDGNGCTVSDPEEIYYMTVTVNALPTVFAGADKETPYGTSIQISDAAASGAEPLSFSWEPADMLDDATLLNPVFLSPESETTFTLTVTDDNGCSASDNIIVSVTGGFLSTNPAADDPAICLGETTQLTANAEGGSGNYTFSWSSVPAGFVSVAENPEVTPAETTIYTVVADDGFNKDTGEVTVVVHELPEIIECPSYGPFCVNDDPVTFTEVGVFTSDGDVITGWDPAEAGDFDIVYTVTDDDTGCENSCTFTIMVSELPVMECPADIELIINEGPLTLAGALPDGGTYTGNGITDGVFYPEIAGAGTHIVAYTYTDGEGCENFCTFEIRVQDLPLQETTFAVVTDFGYSNNTTVANIADMVNSWDPEFIITAGDNNQGTTCNTGCYDGVVGAYYGPEAVAAGRTDFISSGNFWPVPGNHDHMSPTTNYLEYFNYIPPEGTSEGASELYYDFVRGPVHFFMLNSGQNDNQPMPDEALQMSFLQNGLANSTAAWKVVVFHRPPYTSGTYHQSDPNLQWPFEEWGADIVITGHNHIYERIFKGEGELRYITAGASGSDTRTGSSSFDGLEAYYFGDESGAMKVNATDASITFQYITLNSSGTLETIRDTYTMELSAAPAVITSVNTLESFGTLTGSPSSSKSYSVSGRNLSERILITAPDGFEVSTDDINFSKTLSLTQSGGVVNSTAIYVRMTGEDGSFEGNITHISSGAALRNLAVSGTSGLFVTVGLQEGSDGYSGMKDAYIHQENPTYNYGNSSPLIVDSDDPYNSDNDVSALLSWDLSSVPAGSILESASITVYVEDETASGSEGFDMYAIIQSWTEGTGDGAVTENGVTWNTYDGINAWPGGAGGAGDMEDNVLASFTPSTTGTYTVNINSSGIAAIQQWIDLPESNNGFMIHAGTETNGMDISSGEGATIANRPKLTLTYSVPTSDPVIITSVSSLPAFQSQPATTSEVTSYTVRAMNLEQNMVITSPSDFQISTSSSTGFGTSVTLVPENGAIAETTIYVRFLRATEGASSGVISHVSIPAQTKSVAVTGNAAVTPPWTAYNDMSGTSTPANTTEHTLDSSNGMLLDFESGEETGITVTVTSAGEPYNYTDGGQMPDVGTDACEIFNGKTDLQGVIMSATSDPVDYYVDITFNNLDASKTYTFVTTANRAGTESADPPYNERFTRYTISGMDAADNASSSGTQVYDDNGYSIYFCTGDNTTNGYVARWENINPGSDGTFTVRAQPQNPDAPRTYSFGVFMLQEEASTGMRVMPAAAPSSLCVGESSQLLANAEGGSGDYSYSWSSDPAGFASTEANPIVEPTETTLFTVAVNDGTTIASGEVTVTVNPLPEVTCPYYGPLCKESDAVTFTENGVFSYQDNVITGWDPSLAGEFDISYTVTDTTTGCSNSCIFSIVVHEPPLVSAGQDRLIDYGGSAILSDATATGSGALTYAWEPAELLDDHSVINPSTVELLSTTVFTLTVTDGNGCTAASQVTISVANPPLTVSPAASSDTVCSSSTIQLSSNAAGGTGDYTFSWSSDPAGFTSTEANPQAAPAVTTVYTVNVNDGENTADNDVTIIVNPIPEVTCPDDLTVPDTSGVLILTDLQGVSPGNGVFTVMQQGEPADIVSVDPAAGPATYEITYTVTDSQTGCENYCNFSITVYHVLLNYDLTIVASPEEGGITVPESGTHTFTEGTVVDLTALPSAGFMFKGWTGDVDNPGLENTSLTVDGDMSVSALFDTITGPQHFTPVWDGNGFSQMNFYALTARLDNNDLQPGDEIAIFDGDICVGAGVLREVLNSTNELNIIVSMNDPTTSEADGFTPDNTASFRIWDASAEKEISMVEATYFEGFNGIFEPGGSSWVYLEANSTVTQEILLSRGWNIFSLYVEPENTDMLNVVQPLNDDGLLVKVQDERGLPIDRHPVTSNWINNIGDWEVTEGYKIKTNDPAVLLVTGMPVTSPVTIGLTAGWNVISYPVAYPQDASGVLAEIMDSGLLLKVQDETGAAIEPHPVTSSWINNIGDLDPGKGYNVKVTQNVQLTIPRPSTTKTARTFRTGTICSKGVHYEPAWEGNGLDHMNIYISGEHKGLIPGDEIGIFDGTVCVGSGLITYPEEEFYSLVASVNDPTTKEKDGFDKGNRLIFKVWRPSENRELLINDILFQPGGNDLFEPLGTAMVTLEMALVTDSEMELQQLTALGDIYPNPAGNRATIPFSIGKDTKVEIAIFTASGKKLLTLASGNYKPGSYTVEWNIPVKIRSRSTASGIYFCKMITQDEVFVKKLIIK
jgi:hypothetical protein